MESLFSNKYREILEIYGLKLKIDHRWICHSYKESLGRRGDAYIFYDNFGEKYYIIKDILNNTMTIDKGTIIDNTIFFLAKSHMLNPLPDIAIDVLQTCSDTIAIETLTRIADVVKRKINQ
jgi:hypothetical protein